MSSSRPSRGAALDRAPDPAERVRLASGRPRKGGAREPRHAILNLEEFLHVQ
ncbi:MAG: hypothetical protein U0Q16_21825 [Bryobacteraceae bacterium]